MGGFSNFFSPYEMSINRQKTAIPTLTPNKPVSSDESLPSSQRQNHAKKPAKTLNEKLIIAATIMLIWNAPSSKSLSNPTRKARTADIANRIALIHPNHFVRCLRVIDLDNEFAPS